ncbi:sulfite exporter TauE/SafE family protein [Advenella sp. WQ 585]|uniref:Probable membrane transporter protein n=1 Tax=Advenella mandrilli TaxID=2800330 RepID=A0ABS1E8D7_9BURK|nr:sulfite exporter TauE/SafE family protein [Advenella mandrilli]MBK1779881.1 sulfite exporter TauE/SafE family protein [Advenella mandrilli]MDY0273588.1 sulfite exporter TauE/SafE family protein [Advenella sp.]
MDGLLSIPLYLLLGASIGFVGAMVGIGGGLIAIPMLVLLFDMPQQLAQGTALVMIVSNVLLSVRSYNQSARIDFKSVGVAVVINMIATNLAAIMAQDIDPVLLRRLFALFLALIASLYLWQTLPGKVRKQSISQPGTATKLKLSTSVWLGLGSGLIGGIFGVGGSLIIVPVMTLYYGFRQTTAQGMALAMIVPGSCVALGTYAWSGNTHWIIGASMAVGGMFVVRHGVKLAYRLPEVHLKRIFSLVLFLTVALLMAK